MQIQKDKFKIKGRPLRRHIKSLLCDKDINRNPILVPKYSSRGRMTDSKGRSGNPQNTKSFFQTFSIVSQTIMICQNLSNPYLLY